MNTWNFSEGCKTCLRVIGSSSALAARNPARQTSVCRLGGQPKISGRIPYRPASSRACSRILSLCPVSLTRINPLHTPAPCTFSALKTVQTAAHNHADAILNDEPVNFGLQGFLTPRDENTFLPPRGESGENPINVGRLGLAHLIIVKLSATRYRKPSV